MSIDPSRRLFRAQLAEQEQLEAQRYVDLAVEWRLPDDSTLLNCGGVWDKVERRYTGKTADKVKVFRLKLSQVEIAQWFVWWMQEREQGRLPDIWNFNMLGDRAGGKTVFLVAAANTALIKFPHFDGQPTQVWIANATFRERAECEREQSIHFPFAGVWYVHRRADMEYRYVTGGVIRYMSGDKPDTLKQGRVDFLMLNEMAKMSEAVYLNGVGRLKDKQGACLGATNPPRSNRGRWVWNLWNRAKKDETYPVLFLEIDSKKNDAISQEAGDAIGRVVRDMNPRYAQADVDGEMLRIDQPAYFKFNDQKHCRPVPAIGDITREYLRLRTGRAYDFLGGMDFQGRPHMVAVIAKIFGTLDDPILYFYHEIICPQATEEDLADAAKEHDYDVGSILWIGDNSGQWQNGKHLRHQHDSFKAIRDAGYHIEPCIKPKNRDHRPANPPVEQRVMLMNRALEQQQCFVDAQYAPQLAAGLEHCELKESRYGRVVPVGIHAHITDAAGYPLWWVFSKGRRLLRGPVGESVPIERRSLV